MKFTQTLKEAQVTQEQKFSITAICEIARKSLYDKLKDIQIIYKWQKPSVPGKTPFTYISDNLSKLSGKANGPISAAQIEQSIRNDFEGVGLGKYVAGPEDSSWSKLETQMRQIINDYGNKTRGFDTAGGNDITIHLRYDVIDNGTKRFVVRSGAGKDATGVIFPDEQEKKTRQKA